MTVSNIYLVLLAVMSAFLFVMMGIDKSRAKNHGWRVSEARLFLFAFLGGAVGGTLGMCLFRHKTKHWYFVLGFPLLALAQIIIYFVL